MNKIRRKNGAVSAEDTKIKDFLNMIAPGIIKFNTDYFICGNTFRCVWVLREYPTATNEQAILRHLGEKDGVTLRIYTRQVNANEEKKIIHNAANKNRMDRSNTNDLQQTVAAENNLQDVVTLVSTMHRNREQLLHCAVYIELTAHDLDALKLLQTEVLTELVRSKLEAFRDAMVLFKSRNHKTDEQIAEKPRKHNHEAEKAKLLQALQERKVPGQSNQEGDDSS